MSLETHPPRQKRLVHPMSLLSAKLDLCAPLLHGKVVYVDYPVHSNVGDLLIWKGTEVFLQRNNIQVIAQFSQRLGRRAYNLLDACDTICLHGGGNFGDIYPTYQRLRNAIIQKYPNKRIVMFPQTVHYNDSKKLESDCCLFKMHRDLHIFLRDENSFYLLKEQGIPNIALCPDMAHALWEKIVPSRQETSTTLYLLRRDEEKTDLASQILLSVNQSFDWPDLIKDHYNNFLYQVGYQLDRVSGRIMGNYLPALIVWDWEAQRLITQSIDLFSSHEMIITNRLHAMILSALLQKKAIVYDNSYGKLSAYADLWLSDVPNIYFNKC